MVDLDQHIILSMISLFDTVKQQKRQQQQKLIIIISNQFVPTGSHIYNF